MSWHEASNIEAEDFGMNVPSATKFLILKTSEFLAPGEYTFPFKFQLPTGLPGTYIHKSNLNG